MACSLPSGTTAPRGLPAPEQIRWPLVPARELFELKYGRALVEVDRRPGSVPVFGTNGRCGFHNEALFGGPGVVLGRKGQGPLGVEWSDEDYWVIDTAYALALLRQDVDLKFSYYLIKYIGLNHLKDGTSNPTLSRDAFGAQAVPLPPVAVQRAIAHVLGSLDDKIELNRRMSETLEAIARAIHKSWFVDFDPVRSKANGRDPSFPKPLADLFPDRLVRSERGEIPEGWSVTSIDEFVELNPESWSKSTRPEMISYVDLTNTKWGRIEQVTTYPAHDAPSRAQRVLRVGDTIVGTVRPGNGSYAFVSRDGLTGSTGFAVLRPRKPVYSAVAYFAVTAAANIDRLSHLADGGAYPAVPPEAVSATEVVGSGAEIIARFAKAVDPILAKMAQNDEENLTVAALRDSLLPKLISGEIRAPELSVVKRQT